MLQGRNLAAFVFNVQCVLIRWRNRGLRYPRWILQWLRFRPAWLRMVPARLTRSAMTYLARQPLFVIKFKHAKDYARVGRPPSSLDNPQLMLKSTKAVWLWCAVSTVCVSFALTASVELAGIGTIVGLVWLAVTRELSMHSGSKELQAFAGTARYGTSPPATRWKRFAMWTPAALFCTLGSAFALGSALLPAKIPRLYGAGPFLVTALAVALVLFLAEILFYRHFHLPALQRWYWSMPEAIKSLLQPALMQSTWGRRHFSSTWRTIPDIASELNTAGTYVALFSEDRLERPIWRRSRAGLVWYFAPLIVPIAALTFTPLMMSLLPCYSGMDERTKIAYGSGAVVWAAWSFCYFLYFCARDFIDPLRYSGTRYGRLTKVLEFDNLRDRQEVESFFVGSGKTAYDAVIVLVPTALVGFLGLFSTLEPAAAAQSGGCNAFCYDMLRQGCASIGMAYDAAVGAVFEPVFRRIVELHS